MNISPVNYSNYYINNTTPNNNINFQRHNTDNKTPEQKSQSNINIRKTLTSIRKLFTRQPKCRINLPYAIDKSLVRKGQIPRTTIANCYRFGNCNIAHCEPEILETVKANLYKAGIKDIKKKNIKVVRFSERPNQNYMYMQKSISYFDEDSQKSFVFTPDGKLHYKLEYENDDKGNIKDCFVTDICPIA